MDMVVECVVKICEKNSFENKQGEHVAYNTNFLKDGTGHVLEVNSQTDFSRFEGKEGIAFIRAQKRDAGGYRLSMTNFIEDEKLGLPVF